MSDAIASSVDGLRARVVEGLIVLDRPVPVRNMATATVRGLVGHLLREHRPDVADRWFKPGQEGNCPAAYTFQPAADRATVTDGWPFRVVAWDPPDVFIPAVQAVMRHAAGRPFGEGGVRVIGVDWGPVCHLAFEGIHHPPMAQRVVLRTPLRLQQGERWLTEETISTAHLAGSLIRRLNRLSREYGNGLQLLPNEFIRQAELAVETERCLNFVRSARRSSTQRRDLDLSGLVGHISVHGLPASCSSLLSVGSIIHVGKHTAEGCGCLELRHGRAALQGA